MAVAYSEKFSEAINEDFIRRIAIALSVAALTQINAGPPTLPREIQFAQQSLLNPYSIARSVAMDVAANSNRDSSSTDIDIQNIVNSNWSLLAWIFES